MAKLPEEVKIAINKTDKTYVATADYNAVSVVCVSHLKYQGDETVVIADNKFGKMRANLNSRIKLAFAVQDLDTKKAYQVKGIARLYFEGEKYQAAVRWIHDRYPNITPKIALYIQVQEIFCGNEQIA